MVFQILEKLKRIWLASIDKDVFQMDHFTPNPTKKYDYNLENKSYKWSEQVVIVPILQNVVASLGQVWSRADQIVQAEDAGYQDVKNVGQRFLVSVFCRISKV